MEGKAGFDLLTKAFGRPIDGKWETDYGFTISMVGATKLLYSYTYENIPFIEPAPSPLLPNSHCDGLFGDEDVASILAKFIEDPDALRKKPSSIIALERATGIAAVRKHNYFGGWHLRMDDPFFSAFNNPFGVSTGYTKSEDRFEIWYGEEEEPAPDCTLEYVFEVLGKLGYLTPRCRHCASVGKMLRCAKCKIARYCGRECQLADWKEHKKNCE